MTPPDLQKLLGGYAAGTLTPEERRALFDAALADQTLFDALADEEALREVLADPACRGRVQAALVESPPTAFRLWRPAVWTLAAATAAAAVVLTVAVLRPKPAPSTAPQQMAMAKKIASPELVPATPAPKAVEHRVIPRAPAGAGKSETRATRALPPRALVAPRQEASARGRWFSEPPSPRSAGVAGGKLDSPAPAAADAVAPAAKAAAPPPPPPPPPGSVTETVTVTAESTGIVASPSDAKNQQIESQASQVSIAGRDAAELMKVMPGMGAAAGMHGPIGLRYTFLRRGEGDKDFEVPPDTRFRGHESVRLRIEPGQGGYLYVLAGKRALYAGPVAANQPVLIVTRPGVLQAVLLPQADSGPLSTLVSRAQQQLEGVRFQRSDGTHLGAGPGQDQPAPILAEISIKSR